VWRWPARRGLLSSMPPPSIRVSPSPAGPYTADAADAAELQQTFFFHIWSSSTRIVFNIEYNPADFVFSYLEQFHQNCF
jgi:hypothetical protein